MIFSNIKGLRPQNQNPLWAIFWLLLVIFIIIPLLLILAILFIPYYIYKKIRKEPIFDVSKFFKMQMPDVGNINKKQKTNTKPKEKPEIKSEEEVQDVSFEKK